MPQFEDSRKKRHRCRQVKHTLQDLPHELGRYARNATGIFEMRWKNAGDAITEERHKSTSVEMTNTYVQCDVGLPVFFYCAGV